MLNTGFTRLVLFGAAVLFSLAAMAKLVTVFGGVRLSTQLDPVLFISNRKVLFTAAIIELAVVLLVCLGKNPWLKVAATAYLSTMLVLYRLSLWFLTGQTGCDCLGVITRYLPLSPMTVDRIVQLSVTLLIITTYTMLAVEWASSRKKTQQEQDAVPVLTAPPAEN